MTEQSPLEQEVAQLLVDTLNLEHVEAGTIDPESPLFNDGLGLDSIDALELSLGIAMKYGFQIKSDDSNNTEVFSCLRSLSRYIEKQRTK